MKWLTPYAPIIVSLLSVAAFFLVVFIILKRDETAYKLLWLLVILSLPLVGALSLIHIEMCIRDRERTVAGPQL